MRSEPGTQFSNRGTFQRHGILVVLGAVLMLAFWVSLIAVGLSYFSVIDAHTPDLVRAIAAILSGYGFVLLAAVVNGVVGMRDV